MKKQFLLIIFLIVASSQPIFAKRASQTFEVSSSEYSQLFDWIKKETGRRTIKTLTYGSVYWDAEDLTLLSKGNEIVFLSFPKAKKGPRREEIWMNRPKEVFQITARNYKSSKDKYDKHALLHRVKRSERVLAIDKIKSLGIATPLRLKAIFFAKEETRNIRGNKKLYKLTKYEVEKFYQSTTLVRLEIISMNGVNDFAEVEKRIAQVVPSIKVQKELPYVWISKNLHEKVAFYKLFSSSPMILKLAQALGYVLIGIFLFFVFFKKRIFSSDFTATKKVTTEKLKL
ncbi:MAG: hypothetical protein QNL04_13755 [SAR324 cluster bacterium]|nr:hypothetical protein [SAR324 cluster bacterium]